MSYHDLFITTKDIPRTSIFDLPFNYELYCTRASGWMLVFHHLDMTDTVTKVAGEYMGGDEWLVLDVKGHVILDSREKEKDGD